MRGIDVRVITSETQIWGGPLPQGTPLPIPREQIQWARSPLLGQLAQRWKSGGAASATESERPSTHTLRDHVRSSLLWPDVGMTWIRNAAYGAQRLIHDGWRPDIILASALPVSSFVVANRLSNRWKIPWIADLRDLWVDNHFALTPNWRKSIDSRIERRLLTSADRIVTVTPGFARRLRARYPGLDVNVIPNGYDSTPQHATHDSEVDPSPPLRILYTGTWRPQDRSPRLLFEGLKELRNNTGKNQDKPQIEVQFVGPALEWLAGAAAQQGVADMVKVHPPVPRSVALKLQREAHALLLPLAAKEIDVYPGKLFEYMSSRRPIIAIGPEGASLQALITEHELGTFATTPPEVAAVLESWSLNLAGNQPPMPIKIPAQYARTNLGDRYIGLFYETLNGQ